jgi:NADPH:quinone reductase-like Zn-dependent oxidoreductase
VRKRFTPDGKYSSIDDGIAKTNNEDLELVMGMAKSGEFKPVIDKTYPLEKIIEAHKYVEKGHKKGNVVITLK